MNTTEQPGRTPIDHARIDHARIDHAGDPAADATAVVEGAVVEGLGSVQQRIDAACRRSGRDAASVRLLAMSKHQPVEAIRAALGAGVGWFGENTVQELTAKQRELGDEMDAAGARFVLTGHLQTNKARQAVELAHEFQALDSLRLARELDRRAQASGRRLDVLVQVNSSGEASKHGLDPADAVAFARDLVGIDGLRVRGLMTLAVHSDDPDAVRACFQRMLTVQRDLREAGLPALSWDELSMGMSNDYELAIEMGATCVRVGRAIFGVRDYSRPAPARV